MNAGARMPETQGGCSVRGRQTVARGMCGAHYVGECPLSVGGMQALASSW